MTGHDIQGQILIATKQISESIPASIFQYSVIYVHTCNDTGAIGVILNFPLDTHVAEKWSQDLGYEFTNKIHNGGPIEQQIGYILHSNDYAQKTSIQLNDFLFYTGGKNIVNDINRGNGPNQFVLMSGYCSWAPGQLENEIEIGAWVVTDFDLKYVFNNHDKEQSWERSVHLAAQKQTERLLDCY